MNFILLNGPPLAGKDTAGMFAHWFLYSGFAKGGPLPIWEKFSAPHKAAFAGIVHATIDAWFNVDGYEERKDEVIPWLGVSYRQWQIDFSESFMKPVYGKDIFGRLLLVRCFEHKRRQLAIHGSDREPVFIVADAGFQAEAEILSTHNVLIFHISREGCNFDGDSRDWITPMGDHKVYHLRNEGSKSDLRREVEKIVSAWMEGANEANLSPR